MKNKQSIYLFIFLIVSILSGACPAFSQETGFWTEKPAGLYNNTSFGIVTFRGNLLTGMQTTFGYKLNPHIAFGGGIGLERYTNMPTYDTLTANLSLLPIYAEVRWTILDKRVSPVIAVDGGYKVLLNIPSSQLQTWTYTAFPGFAWTDYSVYDTYTQGGFFIAAEAGVKANVWERLNLYLSINYSFWSIAGDHHVWSEEHVGVTTNETHDITHTMAYTDQWTVRLGFGF
jgi:hypothetical protein